MVVTEPVATAAAEAANDDDLQQDVESLYGWIKYVSPLVDDRTKPMLQIVTEMEQQTDKKMALCEEYTTNLAELAKVAKDWQILATEHLFRLCMAAADPEMAEDALGSENLLVRVAKAYTTALRQQQQQESGDDSSSMDVAENGETSGGGGGGVEEETPDEKAMHIALNEVLGEMDDYQTWVVRAHATLYLYSLRLMVPSPSSS